ncbi:MAG: hypothetical protein AAFY29_11435 [Pseudomonadota bacterium]
MKIYRADRANATNRVMDRQLQRRVHYVPERYIDRFYNSGRDYTPDLYCNWVPRGRPMRRWVWTPYFMESK